MNYQAPVIAETDVMCVGGATGAVELALAVRESGRRAFCVSPYTYLGEDVCATARYSLDQDQAPETVLAESVLGCALRSGSPLTPMSIKYGLERALIEADVNFLYMTNPVCLLRDETGAVAGLVVVNRSGFQAIKARVIIDATERALVGRMTGAAFRRFVSGTYDARRVVVGGAPLDVPGATVREWHGGMKIGDVTQPCFEYTLTIDLPDASPQAFGRAEVAARLTTWHPQQSFASDRLFITPTDRLDTGKQANAIKDLPDALFTALRCGHDSVYVLGACADLSDDAAGALMKPCNLMHCGRELGTAMAETVTPAAGTADLRPDYRAPAVREVDGRRADVYFRYEGAEAVTLDVNRVGQSVLYDVVVAGGGTGGAPAGIAAARAGASTLVLESLFCLGGVGTEGRIAKYYHGNRCGFTEEMDRGVHAMAPNPEFAWDSGCWDTEWKKQWLLKAASDAGADVWFGALSVAALMDGGRVCGVLAATPYGLQAIEARAVVDSTGNVDVAAAAGAAVINISKTHVAVQGTGLPVFTPGAHYTNTDHTFVDDTDVMDVTRAFVLAREKFRTCFDLAQIVDSRQRRQVRGEISLDPLDFLAHRTFPDTVVTAMSNFDSHGFTVHPLFMAKAPDKESLYAHVPFRCLLPVGLDGVLVTGLGVSAHRDALPVIRMQPDVQNQGYAAGRAVAMATLGGYSLRDLNIRTLQQHLVEVGILKPEVLEHVDSFPVPDAQVAEAVETDTDDYVGLAVIFGNPERSLPLLREAYVRAESTERKVRYAHLLGLLGDGSVSQSLMDALDATDWDIGWNYRGMGQFGFSLSLVDSMLVALGRTGDRAGVPALLRKAAVLTGESEFSHLRALTLAFEAMPTPEAAPHFARLMDEVGLHSRASLTDALENVPESDVDTSERNAELSELLLARGLYACGDLDGKAAAVLRAYTHDLHGHYARHARAVLGDSA